MNDKIITDNYLKFKQMKDSEGKPSKVAKYIISKYITQEEKDYLKNRWKDASSLSESLYRIVYNLPERHRCPVCGSFTEFVNKNDQIWRRYCSWECKKKNTNLVERHRQGCLKKYGVENISQVPGNREKFAKTMMEKYGHPNNFGRPEIEETMIKKYGVKNISNVEGIAEKRMETMKKNGTFGKSITEDEIFNQIKLKYPDVKRQYKDKERYPWNCDFYIPSLDLFIEYQGYITHNFRPFDKDNVEHIKELQFITQKLESRISKTNNGTVYERIIDIWTVKDPLKRKTAKENNINFIEMWPDWDIDKLFNEIEKYNKKS